MRGRFELLSTAQIQAHLDQLCKPPDSLGKLEALAVRLCAVQQTLSPETSPRRVTIFAADHGVAAEEITVWPSDATRDVVRVMQAQRSASAVMAKSIRAGYEIVDVGLWRALSVETSPLIESAPRRGTGNLHIEPAMSEADFDAAWNTGVVQAEDAYENGIKVVIGGEMGIGNTVSASCLTALLADIPVQSAVGRGAGIDDAMLERKLRVVEAAVVRTRASLEPIASTADVAKRVGIEVGGLEIVALAGFYARSAMLQMTLVLDGFITAAAALLAERMMPGTRNQMIAGHLSCEPGHRAILELLGLEAILELELRLGEATGAIAACALIDLAAAITCDMASLSELNFRR